MTLTKKIYPLLIRFRYYARKIGGKIPRRFRLLGGPALGGLAGLIGGVSGFLIGILLGYLLGELFAQSGGDRKTKSYLKNPGAARFHEDEPGLAAFCALGVLVASADNPGPRRAASGRGREKEASPPPYLAEKILRRVILGASFVFPGPGTDLSLIEHLARLAWLNRNSLNPDLLAESFTARRAASGDGETYGRFLYNLAGGENGKALAREIRLILEPSWDEAKAGENSAPVKDPWKILGLAPGTPPEEVKTRYRKLVNFFHPDKLQILDEEHRETAARAFIEIREAYKKISGI